MSTDTVYSRVQRDGKEYEMVHEVYDESLPDTDTIALFCVEGDKRELVHRMIVGDFVRYVGVASRFIPPQPPTAERASPKVPEVGV